MVYDKNPRTYGDGLDGVWHCPFPREWVERMKYAANVCQGLTVEQIEAAYSREVTHYRLPPGDFLDGPQDARGLPLSWCREEDQKYRKYPTCCTAIYNYDSVPDMVISNGHDDWPLRVWEPVLRA
jgi:hypothetical protein